MVFLLFPILSLFFLIQPQTDSLSDEKIVFALESFPQYKGGADELCQFIYSNYSIDVLEGRSFTDSIVYVNFIVDTLGNTQCHNVKRGFSDEINKEALRVSRLISFEYPAMQGGKPVSMEYTMAIDLSLVGNYNKRSVRKKKVKLHLH